MKKIASFTVNHIDLLCGLYVSRRDKIGEETITTFDMRVTRPNVEPVMDTPAIHAIEHLGATFLRNHPVWADKTVYFGPMGCMTGFYLLVRDADNDEVLAVTKDILGKISVYDGEMPGGTREECGNYRMLDVSSARVEAMRYLDCLNSYTPDFKYQEG